MGADTPPVPHWSPIIPRLDYAILNQKSFFCN